jgi:hypothetical protein
MLKRLYANWMYAWETRLTTRDENRVVRPLEWGFDWLRPFLEETGLDGAGGADGSSRPGRSGDGRGE